LIRSMRDIPRGTTGVGYSWIQNSIMGRTEEFRRKTKPFDLQSVLKRLRSLKTAINSCVS
jgi:hypothetical protein